MEALPVTGPTPRDLYYLLLFIEPNAPSLQGQALWKPRRRAAGTFLQRIFERERVEQAETRSAQREAEVETLRNQLRDTIENYEASVEELRSANEEIISSNEELRSTNEELETTKEELQSTNEELSTLNDEMLVRTREVGKTNSDLVNLVNCVNLPIVMLGRDLRIRRFTKRAEQALNFIPTDLGRLLFDIRLPFQLPTLEDDIGHVLAEGRALELETSDAAGRPFALQIHPYLAPGDRVEGVVLVFLDLPATLARSVGVQAALAAARSLAEGVWDPLAVLDARGVIVGANHYFCQQFQVAPEKVISQHLKDLDHPLFHSEKVRAIIENLVAGGPAVENISISLAGETFRINTRAMRPYGAESEPLTLLLIRGPRGPT